MPIGILTRDSTGAVLFDSDGLVQVTKRLGSASVGTTSLPATTYGSAWTLVPGTSVSFTLSRTSGLVVYGHVCIINDQTANAGNLQAMFRVDNQAIDQNQVLFMTAAGAGRVEACLLPIYSLAAGSYTASLWVIMTGGTSPTASLISALTEPYRMGS